MATSPGESVFGYLLSLQTTKGIYYQIMAKMERSRLDLNRPYLGRYYDGVAVHEGTGEDTIWGESAGVLFEAMQGADIDGCYPGNFATLDSVKTDVNGDKFGISLKVMFDPDAKTATGKLNKYLKELKEFAHDKRNLQLKGGGSKEVEVKISSLRYLVLRIGVPASVFAQQAANLNIVAHQHTHISLGGASVTAVNDMAVRNGGSKVAIRTEFVSAPDDLFKSGQGELYENLKAASIHGKEPGSFKTIDKLNSQKDRIVSYKARNILTHYTGANGLKLLAKTLKDDIDALATFQEHTDALGRKVAIDSYLEKRLSWAVPEMTANQLEAFHDVLNHGFFYAASKDILFRIHMVR